MNISIIQSVWTVVVMVLFVGIVIWAWSGKRRQQFDEAANLPFDDEDALIAARTISEENNHG